MLDTNVVLDWLLFQDTALQPLSSAIHAGRLSLVAHARALDELRRVLQYPKLNVDPPRQQQIFNQYAEVTVQLPDSTGQCVLPEGFPRCRDPDDDHFLSLAYLARAAALVSKDRQVLKLRKRAAKFGVTILTPAQLIEWHALRHLQR